jgi:hypothetical protein
VWLERVSSTSLVVAAALSLFYRLCCLRADRLSAPMEEDHEVTTKEDGADGNDDDDTQEEECYSGYSSWPIQNIKEPHENDVLFGRGGMYTTNHNMPPFVTCVLVWRLVRLFVDRRCWWLMTLILTNTPIPCGCLTRRHLPPRGQPAVPPNGRRPKD